MADAVIFAEGAQQPPVAPSPGIGSKITSAIAGHAALSAAVMVVLLIAVIWLLVTYRGIGPFGPYQSSKFVDDDIADLADEINSD